MLLKIETILHFGNQLMIFTTMQNKFCEHLNYTLCYEILIV